MAFNFGSLLTAIGRALPGYVEGHRQAVQDNWQDLTNYNSVQAGQLENIFTEQTLPTRIYNAKLTAPANTLQLLQSAMNYDVNRTAQQGNLDLARLFSETAYGQGERLLRNGGTLMQGLNGGWNFGTNQQAGGGGGYGGMWPGWPYYNPYQPYFDPNRQGQGQAQAAAANEEQPLQQ